MTLITAMWDQNTHLILGTHAINKAHRMEKSTNMKSSSWGGKLTQTFTTYLIESKMVGINLNQNAKIVRNRKGFQ